MAAAMLSPCVLYLFAYDNENRPKPGRGWKGRKNVPGNEATAKRNLTAREIRQLSRVTAKRTARAHLNRSLPLYALLIPGIVLMIVFHYLPMFGLAIGFEKYDPFLGSSPMDAILKSPWVGLDNWNKLWGKTAFRRTIGNTFIISGMKVLIGFPIPILLALMINEVRNRPLKRTLQTVMYLPHFISWVIVSALFMNILGVNGIVNMAISAMGGKTVKFFMDNNWFRWVLLITSIWKESGWGTIVYLAAITGIDPELYDAARIDRANRVQQIWYITLPGIASTIVMMLILRLGGIMDAGFSQIFVMYNSTVYKTGDIIGTYVYREGLGKMNYSQGTIVGMFNSLINMVLLLGGNLLSRRIAERSIW